MKKLNFKDVRNQKIECEDISIYEGLHASKTVVLENYAINYFGYKKTRHRLTSRHNNYLI